MKQNSEQDIDRILTALRDTEPRTGMEQRILATIEQRKSAAPSRIFPWRLASLTTTALLASVFALHHHSLAPHPLIPHSSTNTPSEASATPSPTHPLAPHLLIPHSSTNTIALKHPTLSIPTNHQLLCDCDPIALAESQAPSHPAPELPLTDQEKLLRRAAHHADPVELAELNAATREARLAEDKADFKNFFNPPEPETHQ